MSNDDIDQALQELAGPSAIQRADLPMGARWVFAVDDMPAWIQTQPESNRMRIVVEIGEPRGRVHAELVSFMEANFHSALDARYALHDGRLVAAFLHPLRELTRDQFRDALGQVVSCALTAGDENSGGSLVFGQP